MNHVCSWAAQHLRGLILLLDLLMATGAHIQVCYMRKSQQDIAFCLFIQPCMSDILFGKLKNSSITAVTSENASTDGCLC